MSTNVVALNGRIGKEIELKKTPTGKSVCSFNLAVNRTQSETDWIPCVAWEGTAELLAKFCGKGSKIGVIGKLQIRNYETNEGQKRTVVEVLVREIEFLESKKQDTNEARNSVSQDYGYGYGPTIDVTSDDLPF